MQDQNIYRINDLDLYGRCKYEAIYVLITTLVDSFTILTMTTHTRASMGIEYSISDLNRQHDPQPSKQWVGGW